MYAVNTLVHHFVPFNYPWPLASIVFFSHPIHLACPSIRLSLSRIFTLTPITFFNLAKFLYITHCSFFVYVFHFWFSIFILWEYISVYWKYFIHFCKTLERSNISCAAHWSVTNKYDIKTSQASGMKSVLIAVTWQKFDKNIEFYMIWQKLRAKIMNENTKYSYFRRIQKPNSNDPIWIWIMQINLFVAHST